MGLKVELKPGERLILGDCLVTNGDQRTRLLIEGQVPILREKEIMTPDQADTPAKRIYLAIQIIYTSRDPRPHHETYFTLTRELVQAVPSAWPYIEAISNHIIAGAMYKALKSRQGPYRLREGTARPCITQPGRTARSRNRPQARVSSRPTFCSMPQRACRPFATAGTAQRRARRRADQ